LAARSLWGRFRASFHNRIAPMQNFMAEPPEAAKPLLQAQGNIAEALERIVSNRPHQAFVDAALHALKPQAAPAVTHNVLDLIGENSQLHADLLQAHEAHQAGRLPGLPTGIPALDELLRGLRPGLTLVGAVPGAGKTALALNVAIQTARDGGRVLFLTADESPERLALKAVCIAGGLKISNFADGWRHPGELLATLESRPWLANIEFVGGHRLNFDALASKAEGAALVVADYVQALAVIAGGTLEMRHAVDALATQLRDIATRCRVPVLALSSLNRAGYEEPTLAALRESGGLEFTADVVALLNCANPGDDVRELRLRVEKNRFGKAFVDVELGFEPAFLAFRERPAFSPPPMRQVFSNRK